ncbi:glycogen phosphorylase 1-like, partial [Trifolium medium]|nr:glycogen phosphorylase 1-like [Trifolium medium]
EGDASLGNGGLARFSACQMDSLATLDYPAWGYGLRYEYGLFRQIIVDGFQHEQPDYWLNFGNPWEIERIHVTYEVKFNGTVEEVDMNGEKLKVWIPGETVRLMLIKVIVMTIINTPPWYYDYNQQLVFCYLV